MKLINWIVTVLAALLGALLAVTIFWSMSVEVFIKLVANMRQKQIDYYRARKPSDLIEAKNLEKQVDQAIKDGIRIPIDAVLDTRPDAAEQGEQISLFGE